MNDSTTTNPPNVGRRLWDQQEDETGFAFSLFQKFLDSDTDTSLKEFAEQTGRSLPSIRTLSSRHHWFERAAAWRQHLAAAACYAAVEAQARNAALWATRNELFREQEWELAQQSAAAVRQILKKHVEDPDAKCSVSEATNLLYAFSKLGRSASESPAQAVQPSVQINIPESSYERDIRRIYGHLATKSESKELESPNPPEKS